MPSFQNFTSLNLQLRWGTAILLLLTLLGGLWLGVQPPRPAKASTSIDKPKLLVRGDYDYPPYEFTHNGEPTGFNIDLIRAVAKVMGYEIDVRLGPWNEVRSDLENGRIDVLAGMYYSPERDKQVDFSTPHVSVGSGLFVRSDSNAQSLDDLRNRPILVQDGDIMHDYLRSSGLTNQIVPITEPAEALRRLASGQSDGALLSSMVQGLYFSHEYNLTNLRAIRTDLPPRRYCFAVREGNLVLLQDLNEGLNILQQTGEYREIYARWFGAYEPRSFYLHPYILWGGLVILALLALSLLWSWSLRRQVALRTAALAQSETKYRSLFEGVPIGLYRVTPEGKILDANQAMVNLLGYPDRQSLLATSVDALYIDEHNRQHWRAEIERGGEGHGFEAEFRRGDGLNLWGHMHGHATQAADGTVIYYECSLEDITQQKRDEAEIRNLNAVLEQRVIERTRQLQESTHEIETFTYSVSHDLRAPLRAINGYSRILVEDYTDRLPPEALQLLAHTRENTQYMARLLDDLLGFIQIGRKKLFFKSVSPDALVHQALEGLQKEQEGRQIELILGDLPTCEADPELLRQVFSQLLSNALKFTRSRVVARIEIGFLPQSAPQAANVRWIAPETGCFYVRDNGVGFDMRYIHKIFGVFQRLHPKPEYEGTGMGLASAQRIIKRHQGRIWAQSEPGQGTTFYFTLGKIGSSQ